MSGLCGARNGSPCVVHTKQAIYPLSYIPHPNYAFWEEGEFKDQSSEFERKIAAPASFKTQQTLGKEDGEDEESHAFWIRVSNGSL